MVSRIFKRKLVELNHETLPCYLLSAMSGGDKVCEIMSHRVGGELSGPGPAFIWIVGLCIDCLELLLCTWVQLFYGDKWSLKFKLELHSKRKEENQYFH